MTGSDMPFRQVHLDFHTTRHISEVGAEFDSNVFAETLSKARVNSVTCFARCHHGYVYYDTQRFPERHHPGLTRDLLREQIRACHARGIRVPVYITVQWDHYTASRHPEWLAVNEYGTPVTSASGRTTSTFEPGFYRFMCLNSPYVDFLKEFTAEVLEALPVDGLFFDIVQAVECSCRYCQAGMVLAGLEPSEPADRRQYAFDVLCNFKQSMTDFVRRFNKDCSIFYNAGHIGPRHRSVIGAYSHLEIESLPSGEWGYLHFPMTVRYARTLGRQCVGMTGKFHTSWGDFHSFKNKAALQFECFQMLALNAGCSIGDQLHPSGAICRTTYDLIGSVYAEVEEKEPWCAGAEPISEIGCLTPEEFTAEQGAGSLPKSLMGATRILQEGAHQFDIIDSSQDFSAYRVLVLPDDIPVGDALTAKLEDYLAAGGAVLASNRSGLRPDGQAFALDALGVTLKGEAPFSPDFIRPGESICEDLASTEHVMYMRGLEVAPAPGAEILAETVVPYFNRTYKHFCSHRHTPSSGRAGYPAVVRNGRTIYFQHPVFRQYQTCAPLWCKRLVLNALGLLLPQPILRHNGPSTVMAAVNEQPAESRCILHLLHYIPERRSDTIDIIEDVIPLSELRLSLRLPHEIKAVVLAPQMEKLTFDTRDTRTEFVIPKLEGHQMVVLEYR